MGTDTVRELEERIMVLTAFTGGIVFELDRDGRFLRVWAGDPALLVRPERELLGRTVSEILGTEEGDRFVAVFRRVIESGESESFDYRLEVQAGRRAFRGEVRRRILDDGECTVIVLVRDVTKQTELQAKLVETERLAAVGSIAASVADEVRQPLAFATASLEILAREIEGAASPCAREALDHARDAVLRISRVAASVGMVASDRRRERKSTDVRRSLEAALVLCASQLRGRTRITVRVDGALFVRADEGEVCQVLASVILNAAQAMSLASSATNELLVEARCEGAEVRVVVTDTGAGVPEDLVPRLFDPFFTTKNDGSSGVGLHLAKGIVERSGGRIELFSRPGTGTAVSIVLPSDPAAREATCAQAPPQPSPAALKVLIVDDEPMFLRSLQLLLRTSYDVTACKLASDALALLSDEPTRFDAVLCDLSMPHIDGIDFHREMERLGVSQRFVLMTGGAFTTRTKEFLTRSGCPRIAKPFTREELETVLSAVAPRS